MPPWLALPPVAGGVVLAGLFGLAILLMRSAAARAALADPTVGPAAIAFLLLAVAAAAGLLFCGVALSALLRDRHRALLEQEGIIEEISQEFDKVRLQEQRERERVELVEGRLARAMASAERIEFESRILSERLLALEARAEEAGLFDSPDAPRASNVAVNVVRDPTPARVPAEAPSRGRQP